MAPESHLSNHPALAMSPSAVLGAAAHVGRNVSALLEAAEEDWLNPRHLAGQGRGHDALRAAKWRLRALTAALELAALEPAAVDMAAGQAPQSLSVPAMKERWLEATDGAGISWTWGPDLGDCFSVLDRGTLTSVLLCAIECVRRQGHGEADLQASWQSTVSDAAVVWLWRFSLPSVTTGERGSRHSSIHEHALAHAGQLLQSLGVYLDMAPGGHATVRLVAGVRKAASPR